MGPVAVNGGTMIVTGTFSGTGNVSVANNAILGISAGKIGGSVAVASGGILGMSANAYVGGSVLINAGGTLAATGNNSTISGMTRLQGGAVFDMSGNGASTMYLPGGLTLDGTSSGVTLRFDLRAGAADFLNMGSFTVNGTNNNLISLLISAPPTVQTYIGLGTYSGADPSHLVLGTTQFRFTTLSLVASGGSLGLQTGGKAVPVNAYWTGKFGAAWDATDPGVLNSNFNDDATADSNAKQYPGATSMINFATTVAGGASNLDTILNIDFDVLGVTTWTGMPAVSINSVNGGTNTLKLEAGGITQQAGTGGLTINSNVQVVPTKFGTTWIRHSRWSSMARSAVQAR